MVSVKRGSGLKFGIGIITAGIAASSLVACSETRPSACEDIEEAMSNYWKSVDIFTELREAGEEPTRGDALTLEENSRRAAIDLLKISEREVGDISKLTEYLAISLSAGAGSSRGQDAGMAGYLMLRNECDLPRG